MTTLLERMTATALRLVTTYGRPMTLRSETEGAYNTSTGAAAITSTESTVRGVSATMSREMLRRDVAKGTDESVVIAASGLRSVPRAGDKLVDRGARLTVVDVLSIDVGEGVAAYELAVRR